MGITVVDGRADAVGSASVGCGARIDALVVDAGLFGSAIGSVDALERVTFCGR